MARMNLLYVHNDQLGYGRLGVKLAEAVKRAGVEIFDDLPNPQGSDAQKFIPHTNGKTGVCAHASWVSTPGHYRGRWEGQSASILTMWESNLLPEPFRESLDVFDTIVVPSQQNQELFSRYHNNVKYVPLGIDPTEWFPVERPKLDPEYFTFLISGGGYRKGSDLVIKAFRKVFDGRVPDGPRPRLFLHSAKRDETPKDDRIELITGKLDPYEERALYAMCHVYVQPSRGEGFGLRPLQAMAQGMPTIATNAHGHAAFGDLITYPLGWTLDETPPQAFHHGPAGSWWEPDFDELCEAMEDAYLNYDKAVFRARVNAEVIGREFTWDETARKYLDAIGRENLELPDVGPVTWLEPTPRRYLVRAIRPHFFEVGGLQYRIEPGKDYWEPADVKRVLFDAGLLDLSCLPQNMMVNGGAEDGAPNMVLLESGLTPEQFERIPNYTASHALCITCGQKLNTNNPTLEEVEAMPMPRESAWQL
jgi:glycosyltransferase involved in cell wall biosynthesis